MKLISARQVWHDAFVNSKENTMVETLLLGTFVQKSIKANSTNAAVHAWLAGKIQHAIAGLPFALQCLGHFLYKHEFTDDDRETAHEAIKIGLFCKYVGQQWTDAKLNKVHYLIFAAMADYKSFVNRGKPYFTSHNQICEFLADWYGIEITRNHWHRDWLVIYKDIKVVCDELDKRALKPVAKVFYDIKEKNAAP